MGCSSSRVAALEKEVKMMDTIASSSSDGGGVNFSQPIGHAFSILSKYRLRDNMDTFGYGIVLYEIVTG